MDKITERIFEGATFDDFLFRPQHSVLMSRRESDLSMPLTRRITICNPVVGANMDTVTREKMMQALSLDGCFGFLDRNCSIDEQVERVKYVKRQHSYIIDSPIVFSRKKTVADAKRFIKIHGVSSLLIEETPGSRKIAGILSSRDILAAKEQENRPVEEFMTPKDRLITGVPDIDIREAEKVMLRHRIEKLPLIDKKGLIKGLITMRDLSLVKQKPYSSKDRKGRLLVGATIGAAGNFMDRAEALLEAGTDCILMDTAHADSDVVGKAIKIFKSKFKNADLACGNIATGEAAKFLVGLGVDAVKVGIGPGRGCRTRLETGAGVPQMQAIRDVFIATEGKIPIMADGGIRNDKDIFLAICAGATTVMMGSILSGTDEAPGILVEDPATGQRLKFYRGMTSPEAVIDGTSAEELEDALGTPAEGQSVRIPYVGSVTDAIKRIRGHLQSAVSYSGEETLLDAHRKISKNPGKYLIKLSAASRKESFER